MSAGGGGERYLLCGLAVVLVVVVLTVAGYGMIFIITMNLLAAK